MPRHSLVVGCERLTPSVARDRIVCAVQQSGGGAGDFPDLKRRGTDRGGAGRGKGSGGMVGGVSLHMLIVSIEGSLHC